MNRDYRAGLAAGVQWARRLATFADLDRLPADAEAAGQTACDFLRGFAAGALEAAFTLETEPVGEGV